MSKVGAYGDFVNETDHAVSMLLARICNVADFGTVGNEPRSGGIWQPGTRVEIQTDSGRKNDLADKIPKKVTKLRAQIQKVIQAGHSVPRLRN